MTLSNNELVRMYQLDDFRGPPSLTHLKRLTTKDGLIQHADHDVPDPSFGYSLDDNARGLIVCLWHYQLFNDLSVLNLAQIYLNYVKRAEKAGGSFHNFLSFVDQTLDDEGSADSIARTFWALAETVRLAGSTDFGQAAQEIINRLDIGKYLAHSHIRTHAYLLLGWVALGDNEKINQQAQLLVGSYRRRPDQNWYWFEDSLRYANAVPIYALAKAFNRSRHLEYLQIAEEAFGWLDKICRINGKPAPIGQNGWYFLSGTKAEFDQQPIDAAKMVMAAVSLYEATKKPVYLTKALDWMSWYDGNNCLSIKLINHQTKGIYDAITPTSVNENQGAESIVTYLMAYLVLTELALKQDA